MILNHETIVKILEIPKNAKSLGEIKESEEWNNLFYSDMNNNLLFKKIERLLDDDKMEKFKLVYKNHAQTWISQIKDHFMNIYTAHGRNIDYDFGENATAKLSFEKLRKTLFNGLSDTKYFQDFGHAVNLTAPSSLLLATQSERGINISRVKTSQIHDYESNESGLEYLVIKERVIKEHEDYTRYWVYDDINYWVYRDGTNGFELEKSEGIVNFGTHDSTKCPAVQFYGVKKYTDNFLVNKTVWEDGRKDMISYNILKTMYENYKYFGAHGKEIRPKDRCDHKTSSHRCQNGVMISLDPENTSTPGACPRCSKNRSVMGEVIHIPIQLQMNKEFMANIGNLYQFINADSNILSFHLEDLNQMEAKFLDSIVGKGYGQTFKGQAVNEDQIRNNNEAQKAKLDAYKQKNEDSAQYILDRAAEMHSRSFRGSSYKLGNKYFLQDVTELRNELKEIKTNTSNVSVIRKKQREIILTEYRNDEKFLQEEEIMNIIHPWSMLSEASIMANRDYYMRFPEKWDMFNNIGTVKALFELRHGNIATFNVDQEDAIKRIEGIEEIFYDILKQVTNGKQDIPEPGAGIEEGTGGGKEKRKQNA